MSNQDIPIEGVNQTVPGCLILQDMRAEHLIEILLNFSGAYWFNTKTMSSEYFSSSYLSPVRTVLSEGGDVNEATFPRSTITGTVENFCTLLLVPLLSNKTRSPRMCIGH